MRRNHILKLLFVFSISIFLQSCRLVNKEDVKETVLNFFSAYRDTDLNQAVSIYPNMLKLKGSFRKSSSIDIDLKDIVVIDESKIIVSITHHWVNPWGVDNTAKMNLYMKKDEEKYTIMDSKNFCMYDDLSLYKFARNTGAIKLIQDTTDVSISSKMTKVESLYDLVKSNIKNKISSGLKVNKGWRWESGYYSDYATGRAVVTNNTGFPIKNPKYIITYYKSDDKTIVTTDDGTVCYDILKPGQSKSFSWYTSYVGNASRANVKVVCEDEDWIEEIIENLPYTGLEYDKYNNGNAWWPFQYE